MYFLSTSSNTGNKKSGLYPNKMHQTNMLGKQKVKCSRDKNSNNFTSGFFKRSIYSLALSGTFSYVMSKIVAFATYLSLIRECQ